MTFSQIIPPSPSPRIQAPCGQKFFSHFSLLINTCCSEWDLAHRHSAAAAKSLQSCPALCDPIDWTMQPTRLHRPWDSPGKNTGVGCHFLLQCMKVKRESEVAQSCPTLCNPMDCSLPDSSVHGIFQARVLQWVASAFSSHGAGIMPITKDQPRNYRSAPGPCHLVL